MTQEKGKAGVDLYVLDESTNKQASSTNAEYNTLSGMISPFLPHNVKNACYKIQPQTPRSIN